MQYMVGTSTEYLPPEARVSSSSVTQKCDVYAFGVVLLEVLTGRLPGARVDNVHVELAGSVRSAFKEERQLSEVVDPPLLHEVYAKKQVFAVFHVALVYRIRSRVEAADEDSVREPRLGGVSAVKFGLLFRFLMFVFLLTVADSGIL